MNTIPINRDLVNFYMEWDFDNLLNLRAVLTHLRIITKEKIGEHFHTQKNLRDFKILLDRLEELCKNVFHWDYERFPDPIDQYAYIADNCHEIAENLTAKVAHNAPDFSPYDLPGSVNCFIAKLRADIKHLEKTLVEAGLKHGFKPANIPNDHFLPGENTELTQ